MAYNIWKFSYWFNFRPEPLAWPWLVFLLAVTTIGVLFYFFGFRLSRLAKLGAYRKLISRLQVFALTNGIIALTLAFFSWQMIPILAARFWLLLWLLAAAIWKLCLFLDYRKITKRLATADRNILIKNQYLPKKS